MTPEWLAAMSKVIDPKHVMMTDDEPLMHTRDQLSVHVQLEGEVLELKMRAMLCQPSQLGPMLDMTGPELFRALLAEESFRDGWADAAT
jgi:hypothetical protein